MSLLELLRGRDKQVSALATGLSRLSRLSRLSQPWVLPLGNRAIRVTEAGQTPRKGQVTPLIYKRVTFVTGRKRDGKTDETEPSSLPTIPLGAAP